MKLSEKMTNTYIEEDTLIQVHMDWRTQEDKYLEERVINITQRYIPAELPDQPENTLEKEEFKFRPEDSSIL